MSHITIIIHKKILPSVDATMAVDGSEMNAQVTFQPADTMTDAQIGNAVERITKRLTRLADD